MTPDPRFIQTVRYRVDEMQLGPYFDWVRRAEAVYAGVPGLTQWQVLKRRTGAIELTEVFTWRDRDAFVRATEDPGFGRETDELLGALGELVDLDSVVFEFHAVIASVENGET